MLSPHGAIWVLLGYLVICNAPSQRQAGNEGKWRVMRANGIKKVVASIFMPSLIYMVLLPAFLGWPAHFFCMTHQMHTSGRELQGRWRDYMCLVMTHHRLWCEELWSHSYMGIVHTPLGPQ